MNNHQTGRSGVPLRLVCCTLLSAALTYACGGGSDALTHPTPTPPIRVIAGAGQTDTIGTVLPKALVVEIHDANGKILPGATVRFTSVDGPGLLRVSPIDAQAFAGFASDVADAQGRAKTLVKLGIGAGTVKLEVAVPELGATDTISYAVKPGALAQLTLSPRDTTIQPGTSYTLKAQATDRASNPISSGVPTYSTMSVSVSGVTISSAGLVTAGSSAARARIDVSYQTISSYGAVSVIPRLPMVINRNQSVVLINSDGTEATTVATSSDRSLSPSSVAATPSVVYHQGDPASGGKIWVVQPNGSPRLLLAGVTRPEGWPRLSPDGAWVYFVRDMKSLWRVHLDGAGLDSLTSFTMARTYAAPTISPDGRSVAIEDGTGVQIVDVATKATRMMSVACGFPKYSPDGAFFACSSASTISIVRIDGTDQRPVADLSTYGNPDDLTGADWTPDGTWLLVTIPYQGALIVEVLSGTVLRFSGLGNDWTEVWQASFVR
jgi:hypothetical protein